MRSRGLKTVLGLVALLLPGGLLLLIGWVLVRAVARASARIRQETVRPGETGRVWQLSFRELMREARASL